VHLVPLLFLFAMIIGSIYLGWATPTESASIGVVAALCLAAAYRELTLKNLLSALDETIKTTSMIMLIILAASFLNFTLSAAGISRYLTDFITAFNLTDFQLLLLVLFIFVMLGFFIETLSLMVITIPIVTPLLFGVGYDPIWFGIIMIIFVELALITPPVGLNLYIVQASRPGEPFSEVLVGVIPYIFLITIHPKPIVSNLSGIGGVLTAAKTKRGIIAPRSKRRLNRYWNSDRYRCAYLGRTA
jgi:tripartite ATP-independent transporter DctM subunit